MHEEIDWRRTDADDPEGHLQLSIVDLRHAGASVIASIAQRNPGARSRSSEQCDRLSASCSGSWWHAFCLSSMHADPWRTQDRQAMSGRYATDRAISR